jgi:tetratricopeptide (TPR) repeat protein
MLSLSENYELSPKDDSWIEECQISIYYCLGRVLEDLDEFTLAHDIYEHLRCVESRIKCFEKSIQKTSLVSAKNRRMKSYAEYCEKHGRIEQAIAIYQKLIK